MKNKFNTILLAHFARWCMVAAILWLDNADTEERQRKAYCEAVAQWQRDAAHGIPVQERFGHPDYDRIYDEACL